MEKKIHKFDAKGKILGRLAAPVSMLLRGKQKANFLPYPEPRDEVVVFNTDLIRVTGKKMQQKFYRRHTGYPGGLKTRSLEELFKHDSRLVLREAVYGMLPKNKNRDKIIKNLKLYKKEIIETKNK